MTCGQRTRRRNPALLDALAADLVEHGYDLKQLTKDIMKSRLYGLSASADACQCGRRSPELCSALSAAAAPQVMMDAIDSATGWKEKFREFPKVNRAIELPNEAEQSDFLDIFGRSRRDTPCICETRIEPNLSQVLYLMFAPELQTAIGHPEGTVAKLVKDKKPTAEIVAELYLAHRLTPAGQPKNRETRPPDRARNQSNRRRKICSGRC